MNLRPSKSPRSILGMLLAAGLLASACDKQAPEAGKDAAKTPPAEAAKAPAAQPPAEPAAPAVADEPAAAPGEPPAGEAAAPSTDYNGSYENSNGVKLTIENFVEGKGFDFAVSSDGSDDCGGLAYKGAAKFSEANTAKSEEEDLFKLDNGAVNFEPSTEMVGMDCARVVDTDFKKK